MVILDGEVLEGIADHGNIDGLHLLHLLHLVLDLGSGFVLVLGLDLEGFVLRLAELACLSEVSLFLLASEVVLG